MSELVKPSTASLISSAPSCVCNDNTDYAQQRFTGADIQCNYNHSGILCGGCQPGLSLALGSD